MALDATPLDIAALPVVVAGPVLRRLRRTDVAVWFALSRPDDVTLHVQPVGAADQATDATVTPVQVGAHLWIVTLTAPAPGGEFTAGSLYEYRASSSGWASEPSWSDFAFGTALPTFPALPTTLDDLVMLHTSCRKAHSGGLDALGTAGDVVGERIAAAMPNARPNLFVMSGDQLYADEVPAPLAPRIRRIAADLVGIDETAAFGALPKIAGRQQPTNAFGFTSSAASDHLWTLGEFLAAYLLYWSDVLWPATLPAWADVDPANDLDPDAGLDEDGWNELVDQSERFRLSLPRARRVLATVPSLMILDDHEVTDDWNLDYPWVQAVYGDPRGARVVANGVLAYALCQHWGNAPDRFAAPGSPEARVLAAAVFTGASPDTPVLRALLGIPGAPPPVPPSVLRDLAQTDSVRYDLHFDQTDGFPLRVILLDERTAREFVRRDRPAARASIDALALMLPTPPAEVELTLVVTPSPAFGTHIVEHVIQPAASLLPGGAEFADFESWSGVTANHQELIARLAAYQPVVVLSGDVHYAFTGAVTFTELGAVSRFAQLTASAARNPDKKTVLLQLLGDFGTKVGVERRRTFAGFHALSDPARSRLASPPAAGSTIPYDDLVDVALGRVFRAGQETPAVLSKEIASAYGLGPGDWSYEITPVDDQQLPSPGPVLDALNGAPAEWDGWDPDHSYTMLGALRASDLHRIGRVWTGLPNVALLRFQSGPPVVVQQLLVGPAGEDPLAGARHHTETRVTLG
jgi:hypothetical protein